MELRRKDARSLIICLCLVVTVVYLGIAEAAVFAQTNEEQATVESDERDDPSLKQEVDTLQSEVKKKEERIKELDGMIGAYRAKVRAQEEASVSLQNQLALLENRIQEKQLAVERAKREIEATGLEIQALGAQIKLQQARITNRETALSDVFVKLQQEGSITVFDAFMARPSLSEAFVRLEELGRIEGELGEATRVLKSEKKILEKKRSQQEERRLALEDQKREEEKQQTSLEEEHASKTSLVGLTQTKEEEFRKIIYELRQQQQTEAGESEELQERLKDRLNSIDSALARGDILLSWPLQVKRGISAHFHDETYPFRKLFEHPGIDIPAPVGTPIRAAAGGYVAWTRVGKQYGNYIMVVHAGGVATIYAHLSSFVVEPDTYVDRGDVIGYSGGRPGDQGAGLSTGPHLHFEVRQNGIPVNPERFLPSLD